ncbi:putative regulator PrlF [compost metagenome]
MKDRRIPLPLSSIRPDGDAGLAHAEVSENDPVLQLFLHVLERDIAANPERLQAVDARLLTGINLLVDGIEIDINAPLSADDE